jgi:hypothetical protein
MEKNSPSELQSLIITYGNTKPDIIYKNINNVNDLILCNIAFLYGFIKSTPYHLTKINDETIPLVEKLIKINNCGFITINGQPALKNNNLKQKSYLSCYIPKEYKNDFISYLKCKSVYYIILSCDNPSESTILEHNFPNTKNYIVTQHKYLVSGSPGNEIYYDLENITNSSFLPRDTTVIWTGNTYINLEQPNNNLFCFLKYSTIVEILKNYIYIDIAGYEYGIGSIDDTIIEFFELYLHLKIT